MAFLKNMRLLNKKNKNKETTATKNKQQGKQQRVVTSAAPSSPVIVKPIAKEHQEEVIKITTSCGKNPNHDHHKQEELEDFDLPGGVKVHGLVRRGSSIKSHTTTRNTTPRQPTVRKNIYYCEEDDNEDDQTAPLPSLQRNERSFNDSVKYLGIVNGSITTSNSFLFDSIVEHNNDNDDDDNSDQHSDITEATTQFSEEEDSTNHSSSSSLRLHSLSTKRRTVNSSSSTLLNMDPPFQSKFQPQDMRLLALVAHNNMKQSMKEFVIANKNVLKKFRLTGTNTTMTMLKSVFGDDPEIIYGPSCKSGPLGGDAQLVAMAATGQLGGCVFFIDPMDSHPHNADIDCLVRQGNVHNILMMNNPCSAHVSMNTFRLALEEGRMDMIPSFFLDLESPSVHAYRERQDAVLKKSSKVVVEDE